MAWALEPYKDHETWFFPHHVYQFIDRRRILSLEVVANWCGTGKRCNISKIQQENDWQLLRSSIEAPLQSPTQQPEKKLQDLSTTEVEKATCKRVTDQVQSDSFCCNYCVWEPTFKRVGLTSHALADRLAAEKMNPDRLGWLEKEEVLQLVEGLPMGDRAAFKDLWYRCSNDILPVQ